MLSNRCMQHCAFELQSIMKTHNLLNRLSSMNKHTVTMELVLCATDYSSGCVLSCSIPPPSHLSSTKVANYGVRR